MRPSWTGALVALAALASQPADAALRETTLTLTRGPVTIAGATADAMRVNGSIPGPTLEWTVGDVARIHVRNAMDVASSVHWHGLLLPNRQDGVPGLTTPAIQPGTTLTYEFPIRHAGTYWYHSHTGLQEQRGIYGSIVIHPREPRGDVDRDFVLVLSDWTEEDPNEILRLLKAGRETFSLQKGTMQSLWGAWRADALGDVLHRSLMRMPPMDISDVAYDAFLANGRPEASLPGRPGERIRLRIINAAASSYFYLSLAGAPLRVISADGMDVEPLELERLLMGVAETYDLLVSIPPEGAWELRATAQDGSGHTSLWIGEGERRPAPDVPRPNLYRMRHGPMQARDAPPERPLAPYPRLRAATVTEPPAEAPRREIRLRLTGNMERYVWSFDGRTLSEADEIPVRRGEVLRVVFENTTMMHHPLHLHGHFFRVLNGAGPRAPLKHTVDVAPLATTAIEFLANEEKDWLFHCHILYHMKSGMTRIFHYEGSETDPDLVEARKKLFEESWYAAAEGTLLSNFSEGRASLSSTRHELALAWEVGWRGVDGSEHELEPVYRYHFNRFYRAFAGASFEEERDAGVFGVEALLPLNLNSWAWIDTRGEARFGLEQELQLTSRLSAVGEMEYDTEEGGEGSLGLRYTLGRRLSLALGWHSEFDLGAGLELRY